MDRLFPQLLKQLHEIEIDYDIDEIDYEPYESFNSEEDTSTWIKAWTGNDALDGREYLIFGQDGTGGYAAFWLVHDTDDILMQPVVFFGSEGQVGVVASNFYELCWLFAAGFGPYESVEYPDLERPGIPKFEDFAKAHAAEYRASVTEILARAKREFPDFEQRIDELCN
ncbi:SMI1/KNR4 family protein [Marinobacterium mangrovicola]|uniref:SMI1/KNR4 family protein n=1 Tax=Marinobacterium mangrovicola TaxID=1476959 RepID=A0A4R1GL44_9GAMM|nr:SMI1/KNR4 family protein [Marinobacterium mangrovicola]TCK09227.1 hypothetical protein CLV83_1332 [Marinobacterium mangrovicola]